MLKYNPTFIGDIHADTMFYQSVCKEHKHTIQVGDFGCGFFYGPARDMLHDIQIEGDHTFIRGNHDNPNEAFHFPGYIRDGYFDERNSMFFVGGAWSIDHALRTEGVNWWREEELSYHELNEIIVQYLDKKPKIMVTHDAPLSVTYEMFIGEGGFQQKTRTGQALQDMFAEHQPEIWVFGHWHQPKGRMINGTYFRCMGINETEDLETMYAERNRPTA